MLEVARDPESRARGLMGRTQLRPGHGMVFVFEHESMQTFWMKNVPFDIDIGFFDAKGKLVNALTMQGSSALTQDHALPRYSSAAPAQFAVEVEKGFFSGKKNCELRPIPN